VEDADDINNIANDLVDHDVGKGREDEFAGSLYLPRHVHGTETSATRPGRCKFPAPIPPRGLDSSQTNNQRYVRDRRRLPRSSGDPLTGGLFFSQQPLDASADVFVGEHLALFYLRQAFFHVAHKPFIVINQSLDSLAGKFLGIAALFGQQGKTVWPGDPGRDLLPCNQHKSMPPLCQSRPSGSVPYRLLSRSVTESEVRHALDKPIATTCRRNR